MKIEWIDRNGGGIQEARLSSREDALKFIKGLEEGGAKNVIIKLPEKVYVTAMLWGGTLEEVKAFETREKAEDYKVRKDDEYGQHMGYEGVEIFERELE
ncbi:MAG: hypothetical protein D6733_01845 [Methanobacteriota archaeon]|nr:MAG: hypothetical protein D6733_01845 [Euryarchaeota archaeon]